MAFESLNFTPIGGNSRSGIETDRNAPMGWAYASQTDTVENVRIPNSYFDSVNKIVAKDQFIYAALADGNVIFTIELVDRVLQQVTLATKFLQPVAPGPNDVTPVFLEADFGDPTDLDEKEKFLMMAEVTLTEPLNVTSGVDSINTFQSSFFTANNLLFNPAATQTLYTSDSCLFAIFRDILIQDISNGASVKGDNTLLDISGVFSIDGMATLQNSIIKNFSSIGTVFEFDRFTMRNGDSLNSGAITINDCLEVIVFNWLMGNTSTSNSDVFISFLGLDDMFFSAIESEFRVKSGEAALFIDPAIGDDSTIILEDLKVDLEGTGEFFKSGSTGVFAANGWAENGATGSVTAIDNAPLNLIEVTTSVAHGMVKDQKVTLSSMTISGYDDQYSILNVPTTTTLQIKQTFLGTASGSWETESTTTSSPGHGLPEGTSILVINSLSYLGGTKIYNVTASGFDINRAFDAGILLQNANWDTGSLTGSDRRVTVRTVEGEPDSKDLFQYAIDGWNVANAVPTTFSMPTTANTYVNLDFGGATPLLNGTSGFTLVNGDTGRFRFDGAKTTTFMLSGFIVLEKLGNDFNFVIAPFRAVGGGPTTRLTDISQNGTSVSDKFVEISFAGAVTLSPGEQLEMKIGNLDETASIAVAGYSFIGS